MLDDRHFAYDTLSPREVRRNALEEKGRSYLMSLCNVNSLCSMDYKITGEVLTFKYNTFDNNGKLITIRRKVQLEKELVKDQRLMRTTHADVFFDRASNSFLLRSTECT